jgi:hypothetical protein
MHRKWLGLPGLLLIAAVPAFAQDGRTGVTVYAGPSFVSGERTFIAEPDVPVTTEYDTGWRVGVRVTRDVRENVSVEGTYNFGRNALNVTQTAPVVEFRNFPFWMHQFNVNGLYYFDDGTRLWRPFATAGIGMTRFSPTDDAQTLALADAFLSQPTRIEADNILSFNFGGGVERSIGEATSVRFELRDTISDHPTFGLPETPFTPGGAFFPSTGSAHNVEATAGLMFRF